MMASTEPRLPLVEAEALAAEIIELLRPACERIEIAGSIRRRKPEVRDIEIVAIPRIETVPTDLFGGTPVERDLLDDLTNGLLARGTLGQRRDVNGVPRWGDRTKFAWYRGVKLDLFAVKRPAQWGWIYLIRTGPREFNLRLVRSRMRGGFLPQGLMVENGAVWRLNAWGAAGQTIPTPEEEDVFQLFEMDWIAPEARR